METYPGGEPNVFNMAVMGLRLAQRANGVSTAARPGQPRDVLRAVAGLRRRGGADHLRDQRGARPDLGGPRGVPARRPADRRQRTEDAMTVGGSDAGTPSPTSPTRTSGSCGGLREQLVTEVRERLRASWRQRGAGTAELGWIDGVLDPDVLTIGFARRVPSYKRLTLMLRDRDRLMELLLHPERPIQIVVAGKAHPADDGGKRLVQELVRFADDPRVRHRLVFLPDYGMAMAQKLYPGCDVWLNNPLRPLEACGTSAG